MDKFIFTHLYMCEYIYTQYIMLFFVFIRLYTKFLKNYNLYDFLNTHV